MKYSIVLVAILLLFASCRDCQDCVEIRQQPLDPGSAVSSEIRVCDDMPGEGWRRETIGGVVYDINVVCDN